MLSAYELTYGSDELVLYPFKETWNGAVEYCESMDLTLYMAPDELFNSLG